MKNEHAVILKEITDELQLLSVSGGSGHNPGPQIIWGAIMGSTPFNCSLPGGFYGPSNPTPTGAGTCTGGNK